MDLYSCEIKFVQQKMSTEARYVQHHVPSLLAFGGKEICTTYSS